jgi:hypothetical protein
MAKKHIDRRKRITRYLATLQGLMFPALPAFPLTRIAVVLIVLLASLPPLRSCNQCVFLLRTLCRRWQLEFIKL